MDKRLTMYFDGGSRGNPGLSGIGFVFYDELDSEIHSKSIKLEGDHTNNQAEYKAIIYGLEFAIENNYKNIDVFGDSELIIKQLNGKYKCKSVNIIELFNYAKSLLDKFDNISLSSVKRKYNKRADELANIAMDS